jgi:hypothetical protein
VYVTETAGTSPTFSQKMPSALLPKGSIFNRASRDFRSALPTRRERDRRARLRSAPAIG